MFAAAGGGAGEDGGSGRFTSIPIAMPARTMSIPCHVMFETLPPRGIGACQGLGQKKHAKRVCSQGDNLRSERNPSQEA
jgi:hypothetical protein